MNIYDFKVNNDQGKEISLQEYEGKVLLIVNTATQCGLTNQYEALEALYKKYENKNVEVLDFPCNQFLEQAPGTMDEINEFCSLNYQTTFPRFEKLSVNGEEAHPLFKYLKEVAGEELENEGYTEFKNKVKEFNPYFDKNDIKWNFTKFLIDAQGQVIARYAPTYTPDMISKDIEKLLG
ncbi:MAG: glutathione peroxidase [Bacilli bacterium]|nr:glutathione peroxidase [Bacilli bacterium]